MKNIALWLLTFTLLLVAGCAPAAPAPVKLRIGISPTVSLGPLQVAKDAGYFVAQGLDVEFVEFRSVTEMVPALADGQLDAAAPGLAASFVNAVAAGTEMKLIMPLSEIRPQSCSALAFVARKSDVDAGRFTNEQGWKGARIVIQSGRDSATGYYADSAVRPFGLTVDDLELVKVDAANFGEALTSNQADLVTAPEPTLTRLLGNPDLAMVAPSEGVVEGLSIVVLAFGPRLLEDKDLGTRVTTAVLQAVRQIAADGATGATLDSYVALTKLEPELLQRICFPAMKTDGSLNTDVQLQLQAWLKARGAIDRELSLDELYAPEFVEAALQRLDK